MECMKFMVIVKVNTRLGWYEGNWLWKWSSQCV